MTGIRECPFCTYSGPVLASYSNVFVIEPLNPVVAGHVLVIPREHVADALTSPVLTGLVMEYAARYASTGKVGSCNILTSAGKAATQTVFHLHVHVVPRRKGDGLLLPWSKTVLT
jgi:histidine triad (HIT) family protein